MWSERLRWKISRAAAFNADCSREEISKEKVEKRGSIDIKYSQTVYTAPKSKIGSRAHTAHYGRSPHGGGEAIDRVKITLRDGRDWASNEILPTCACPPARANSSH